VRIRCPISKRKAVPARAWGEGLCLLKTGQGKEWEKTSFREDGEGPSKGKGKGKKDGWRGDIVHLKRRKKGEKRERPAIRRSPEALQGGIRRKIVVPGEGGDERGKVDTPPLKRLCMPSGRKSAPLGGERGEGAALSFLSTGERNRPPSEGKPSHLRGL